MEVLLQLLLLCCSISISSFSCSAPPQLDLLLLHGLADEVVPAAWVQRNEQQLRELSPPGGSVTVRRKGLPGLAHEVTPEEVSVLVAIDQRLRWC